MEKTNHDPIILLDCDVVIHFLKGEKSLELNKIFPGRMVMLDKVKAELMKRDSNHITINAFLVASGIATMAMPTCEKTLREYVALKKVMDDGEAACLAVARFSKDYVASSNITQIKTYCDANGITYYTTMDLLIEAEKQGVMSEAECDQFITLVKQKKSKLPCNTLNDYKKMKGI